MSNRKRYYFIVYEHITQHGTTRVNDVLDEHPIQWFMRDAEETKDEPGLKMITFWAEIPEIEYKRYLREL